MSTSPPAFLAIHIVDVHCHPTDTEISTAAMEELQITICAMSASHADQSRVRDLATKYPNKVIPCFGYHPWFVHHITFNPALSKEEHYKALFSPTTPEQIKVLDNLLPNLPSPILLDSFLEDLRKNFTDFPRAMLGEVGLDRAARIPYDYDATPRILTPFTIPFEHQIAILEAQLSIAVDLHRNVSVHSVKSQKPTLDLLNNMAQRHGDAWLAISVDMHSCGLSPEMWRDIERKHPNVFLSLSTVINSRSPNHLALIRTCSPHRILVESDYNTVEACAPRTWDMLLTIAREKEWHVEDEWEENVENESEWGAVRRLEENWKKFERGGHSSPVRTKLS